MTDFATTAEQIAQRFADLRKKANAAAVRAQTAYSLGPKAYTDYFTALGKEAEERINNEHRQASDELGGTPGEDNRGSTSETDS